MLNIQLEKRAMFNFSNQAPQLRRMKRTEQLARALILLEL